MKCVHDYRWIKENGLFFFLSSCSMLAVILAHVEFGVTLLCTL